SCWFASTLDSVAVSMTTVHCYCFSCLCVYSFGGARALHSLPTRRSSDLVPRRHGGGRRARRARRDVGRGHAADARPRGGLACRRSKEHTSELQSRENLVCRLLLEKKKTELLTRCVWEV